MNRSPARVAVSGLALILIGIALGALVTAGGSRAAAFVPFICGVAVCSVGAIIRVPGMYLPGVIIAGAGVAVVLVAWGACGAEHRQLVGLFLLCIGGSLCVLPPLSLLTGWRFVLWPLPPALVFLTFGVVLMAASADTAIGRIAVSGWRFAVAISVAYIVVVMFRARCSDRD
jgi:hypothetical protein